ncbi:MAG TPA: DUF169 domain-containing protein, partial [Kofleriaceae bacterium]|nr:DUF169 domain-containing protein [Kofleriaceae bacterium]
MSDTAHVQKLLGLRLPPVAVAFRSEVPEGIPARAGAATPAGCAFWREAAEGKTFYTVPADHQSCAVGCHTHNIANPDVMPTVERMVESGYVSMDEIPHIPRLAKSPRAVVYGPAEGATFAADVVIVGGRPSQLMLLNEACIKAGAHSGLAQTLGRPGCAALPLALNSGAAALSFGCKGNRLFTGTPDDEL